MASSKITLIPFTIHSVSIGNGWIYCSCTWSLLFNKLPVICKTGWAYCWYIETLGKSLFSYLLKNSSILIISLFSHLYIHVNLQECQEELSKMTAAQLCLNTITDFSLTYTKSITPSRDTESLMIWPLPISAGLSTGYSLACF